MLFVDKLNVVGAGMHKIEFKDVGEAFVNSLGAFERVEWTFLEANWVLWRYVSFHGRVLTSDTFATASHIS